MQKIIFFEGNKTHAELANQISNDPNSNTKSQPVESDLLAMVSPIFLKTDDELHYPRFNIPQDFNPNKVEINKLETKKLDLKDTEVVLINPIEKLPILKATSKETARKDLDEKNIVNGFLYSLNEPHVDLTINDRLDRFFGLSVK